MERPQHKPEKVTPKLVLHFLRHSMKEKAPEKNDKDVLLTPEGRALVRGIARIISDPHDD